MKILFNSLMFSAIFAISMQIVTAQANPANYRIFDGNGNVATLDQIIEAAGASDVVFLGEYHDDAVAHALQMQIFQQVVEKYSANRKVTLSLEMFERDVQIVLDEYLGGLISENHFLSSSRPWNNYKQDYRPLVELAKARKLPVVAANAPRRYVNMVSRGGRPTLNGLSKDALKWLAPLPFAAASEAYSTKFKSLMGSSPEAMMGIDRILDSQSLWDATMAYSVATALKKSKNGLVVHLNGGFHTENRLGTVEHLLRYRKNARVLVVTMRYEQDFAAFNSEKHKNLGDFVILTDTKVPRSFTR